MTQPESLRTCSKCGKKALSHEDLEKFIKTEGRPYGRRTLCKECRRKSSNVYNKNNPLKLRYRLMINRCYNPKNASYKSYYPKNITVCEEWKNDREAFVDWGIKSGFSPELTLDRIDNSKGYSPENCHWVTALQQAQNRDSNTTNYEKGTRVCFVCHQEKPLSYFYKNKKDYTHYCKKCRYVLYLRYKKLTS